MASSSSVLPLFFSFPLLIPIFIEKKVERRGVHGFFPPFFFPSFPFFLFFLFFPSSGWTYPGRDEGVGDEDTQAPPRAPSFFFSSPPFFPPPHTFRGASLCFTGCAQANRTSDPFRPRQVGSPLPPLFLFFFFFSFPLSLSPLLSCLIFLQGPSNGEDEGLRR